eukprot:1388591-Rhodomonas_salina.1
MPHSRAAEPYGSMEADADIQRNRCKRIDNSSSDSSAKAMAAAKCCAETVSGSPEGPKNVGVFEGTARCSASKALSDSGLQLADRGECHQPASPKVFSPGTCKCFNEMVTARPVD